MTLTITRTQAARMLRETRRAVASQSDRAGELIGWAFSAMRDNPRVARLKIDHLLDSHAFDSADALIARRLMQGADDPRLRLRLARSLHAQGRLQAADAEVRNVLKQRPGSCAALVLASRIASDLGDDDRAVAMLVLASDEKPRRGDVQCLLVQKYLDRSMVERAAWQLSRMQEPPAALWARVWRAQGRTLEAIELLEAAFHQTPRDESRLTELLMELIGGLESVGDRRRLCELLPQIAISQSRALLRTAEGLWRLGDVERAAEVFRTISESAAPPAVHRHCRLALGIIGALDTSLPRQELLAPAAGESSLAATAWLCGFLSQFTGPQCATRLCGSDPTFSVLRPLLADAVELMDRRLADGQCAIPARAAALERHRALCRQALGRVDVAPGTWPRRQRPPSAARNRAELGSSLRKAA